MRSFSFRTTGLLVAATLTTACYQGVSLTAADTDDPLGHDDGSDGTGASDDDGGSSGDGPASQCANADLTPSRSPLRRLTAREYERTVSDLFGGMTFDGLGLVEESPERYYSNNVLEQPITSLHIERYAAAAQQVANEASAALEWAPCDLDGDEACVETTALWLAERAYRRPLSDEEADVYSTFARTSVAQHGTQDGLRMLIEALLESPYFLYRPELGVAGNGEAGALTGYELASRLSYLLWESMPDDALFAAAADGTLSSDDGLRAQAERLLADPRAEHVVSRFHAEYFKLHRIADLDLDATSFPELDEDLKNDLAESTRRFLDDAFWDGNYAEMLEGKTGWVNDRLAPLFGVESPGSETLVRVDLPAEQRSGALLQPGVLAASSLSLRHSPTKRGVFVLEQILCSEPAPPPDNVEGGTEDEGPSDGRTVRELIEQSHSDPSCQTCHHQIDGIGFVFENYDALGRFRTEDNGQAVDASGTLYGTDVDRDVAGPQELLEAIGESNSARACIAEQWFSFAHGRSVSDEDECAIETLAAALEASEGDMQSMLLEIVMSPAFRERAQGEEE
jgi:hypothetical protein